MSKLAFIAVLLLHVGCSGSSRDARAEQAHQPADPGVEALRAEGKALFFGRAGCVACHKVGSAGSRIIGPNLGVGDGAPESLSARAARHHPGMPTIEYVVRSMLEPDEFVVPGYARGLMKPPNQPPLALTSDEMVAVAAYLAGQGNVPPLRAEDVAGARRVIEHSGR